ncbi:DNA polymerase III subunit delta' [Clostridium sp. N3C]|uniref:DNA polymerase III subunit delta' n=1 Tax=Clostridium sp. N3C TaxID=1776758 RepID=UPI00092E1A02|nr:DNA polymerase III subunit delta' [Clostridium sp. N3C]SCN23195.1 DNA polymerase III subunit delta' [Clostridium sp. N3C]
MSNNKIIGHELIRQYFHNAIGQGALSHAHLLVGDDGIGKSLIAKEAAVKILGKTEIKQYVDILEYRILKGKKLIGVDEIRNVIEEVNKRPYEGDKKVIIVHNTDKLTTQAQNAFLKTIEEPPKGVYIFLLVENNEAILDTIKSRCQIHKLNSLTSLEMEEFINKVYPGLEENKKKTLLAFSNGIPGRCQLFMENEDFNDIRNTSAQMILDMNRISEEKFQEYSKFLLKYKDYSDEVLDTILSYIRDIIIYKDTGKLNLLMNKDKASFVEDASAFFSYKKLEAVIGIIKDVRSNLNSNVNPSLTFDVMLATMLNS